MLWLQPWVLQRSFAMLCFLEPRCWAHPYLHFVIRSKVHICSLCRQSRLGELYSSLESALRRQIFIQEEAVCRVHNTPTAHKRLCKKASHLFWNYGDPCGLIFPCLLLLFFILSICNFFLLLKINFFIYYGFPFLYSSQFSPHPLLFWSMLYLSLESKQESRQY